MAFKFENLRIWRLAVEFSDEVHTLTKTFPVDERWALSSQFNRASDSVSLNIAEGSIGQSNAEQKRFLGYSIRSIAECVNCLYLARNRKYIDQPQFEYYYGKADLLMVKTCKFRKAIGTWKKPTDDPLRE